MDIELHERTNERPTKIVQGLILNKVSQKFCRNKKSQFLSLSPEGKNHFDSNSKNWIELVNVGKKSKVFFLKFNRSIDQNDKIIISR